jgi:hypothetical protein
MIPILSQLLVTSMDASNISGIPSSRVIIRSLLCLEDFIRFTSVGDSEKKAASAPDTSAERISNSKTTIIAINRFMVNGYAVTSKILPITW